MERELGTEEEVSIFWGDSYCNGGKVAVSVAAPDDRRRHQADQPAGAVNHSNNSIVSAEVIHQAQVAPMTNGSRKVK